VGQGTEWAPLSVPDYTTPVGSEIFRALHGQREYSPDVMQLLYVTNRYEKRAQIEAWLRDGGDILCDRYLASSIAYGEAQGLDPGWLGEIQRFLPTPALTVLLDIAPETAVRRKSANRDRYERDLALLSRVRASYKRQAHASDWLLLDGDRPKNDVAKDVIEAVASRLGLP
jgi:dTMP kinase